MNWPRRHWRLLAGAVTAVVFLLIVAVGVVGWIGSERAIHPARKVEAHALGEYQFAAITENVRFPSGDGTPLAGWFIPGAGAAAPTVVLLHGYGNSRAQLLPDADFLHAAGYNVLMFDMRGRGESGGGAVTAGAREPNDVEGAVTYLLTRSDIDPGRIALEGVSLGASAGIIEMGRDQRVAAIVAEAPFSDLSGVIKKSFTHFVSLPSFPFAQVTTWIVERRLGVSADDVRPIDSIRAIGQRPVFIIQDQNDDLMPPRSGERIYDLAPGPKELWLIDGAGHADGLKTEPAEYPRRVLAFYETYLGGVHGP